jgi:NAD(P)-dependent dehydrogenase (short-subunit alcohol dehydrogenase family)
MGRLANKALLITGSTGMAQATALLAAAEGARVFVVGKDADTVTDLAARARGACHVADLTSTEQTDAAVSACVRHLGRIDGLFHVAGISGRRFGDGPLHECTDEGWSVTLEVNLGSTFRVCRAVLRTMLQQAPDAHGRRGVLLTMGSVTAISPERRHFATHAYAASKSGVMGLSEGAAAYYAPHGIRINSIAPGLVRTRMSRRAQSDPEILAFMKHKQPLADLIEPEDIAGAAVFLLSDEARTITGVVFPVDAGWRVS